jgi:hypothetical protein
MFGVPCNRAGAGGNGASMVGPKARQHQLYLLMLGLFYVHVGEEVIAPFPFSQAIAAISGTPWSDADFTFRIILIGPIVWVFGAWSLWKRQPFGNAILWYMTIGMILGEPSHLLVFPVMAMNKFGIGYQYFAGMYTALFPMIPAILALTLLLRSQRSAVALAAAPHGYEPHIDVLYAAYAPSVMR